MQSFFQLMRIRQAEFQVAEVLAPRYQGRRKPDQLVIQKRKDSMFRVIVGLFLAVLIVGGIASLDVIPHAWFDQFPEWLRIALVTCVLIFSACMFLGYILDSGLIQRIFKKKRR